MATARLTPEDGVGAEPGLVRRAVEIDQQRVDPDLLGGFVAGQRVEDLAVDGIDRLQHALAAVAALVAVAKLDRLVGAGGGARRNGRATEGAGFQRHIDLDGRIAAAVENFAGVDVSDHRHGKPRDGLLALSSAKS